MTTKWLIFGLILVAVLVPLAGELPLLGESSEPLTLVAFARQPVALRPAIAAVVAHIALRAPPIG